MGSESNRSGTGRWNLQVELTQRAGLWWEQPCTMSHAKSSTVRDTGEISMEQQILMQQQLMQRFASDRLETGFCAHA